MVTIKVAEYHTRCGVRSKGREFYNLIIKFIPDNEDEIRFDFDGVTFVSASFLEESVFKLLDNHTVSIVERLSGLKTKAKNIIEWNKLKVNLIERDNILVFSTI